MTRKTLVDLCQNNEPRSTIYEGIGSSGGIIWSGTLYQAFEVGGCLIAYKKGLDSLYINCGLGITGILEIIPQAILLP